MFVVRRELCWLQMEILHIHQGWPFIDNSQLSWIQLRTKRCPLCQHDIDDTDQFMCSGQYSIFIRQSLLPDLPLTLLPHVKLEFCYFLFFNVHMLQALEESNLVNCAAWIVLYSTRRFSINTFAYWRYRMEQVSRYYWTRFSKDHCAAIKSVPVTFPPLTFTDVLEGVNV